MKLFKFTSRYGTYVGRIVKTTYRTGHTALLLESDEGPIASITVNMGGPPLPEGQVFVKDYSENEGMMKSLKDAGLVKSLKGFQRSGHVTVDLVELDMEKLKEYLS